MHRGYGVVSFFAKRSKVDRFLLGPPGVGVADGAVVAALEQNCLVNRSEGYDGFVLDVAKWKYELGRPVWWLVDHGRDAVTGERRTANDPATRNGDGGRSFVVNDAGEIACQKAPHLVLGLTDAGMIGVRSRGGGETTPLVNDVGVVMAVAVVAQEEGLGASLVANEDIYTMEKGGVMSL